MQSLNDSIKEVLLISHIDLKAELPAATVNLSEMLESLIVRYMDYAEPLSINFFKEIEPAVLTCGDELLLKKALGNVIGNAISYSPEHSCIRLRLSRMDRSRAELTVVNTNTHIGESDLPHLFEAFYRADKSVRYGSGLGLYITRMILETYQVTHSIENIEDGVKLTAIFAMTDS